jgi:hypothetical protein
VLGTDCFYNRESARSQYLTARHAFRGDFVINYFLSTHARYLWLVFSEQMFILSKYIDISCCRIETFEKCSILFKFKEDENFNHPREIGFAFHRASRNTLSILRIKI